MDRIYQRARREFELDPSAENLNVLFNIYRRTGARIEATFYPQKNADDDSFYDDTENKHWGEKFDVTEYILQNMSIEEALSVQDSDVSSDFLIPDNILDEHYPHPYNVAVEKSIRQYFQGMFPKNYFQILIENIFDDDL